MASGSIVKGSRAPDLRIRQSHLVALFHNRNEEYDTLLPFIKKGLVRGDKVLHVVDPQLRKEHLQRLQDAGIDVKVAQARHELEVKVWQDAYLRKGHFDQHDMIAFIEEALKLGRAQGFRSTRFIGQMEWILEDRPAVEDFLEYETQLNYVLPKYRDPVICVYNCARFDADIILDLLRTHPMVMIAGVMHQNPFFVPPEEMLREIENRRSSVQLLEDGLTAENRRLRRAIRELMALSVLPAAWVGYEPDEIADQVLSILITGLQLDAAYIRVRRSDGTIVERSSTGQWREFEEWLKQINAPNSGSDVISSQQTSELSVAGGTLHVLQIPIGMEMEAGGIVVGSLRPAFPSEMEMMVLTVAANQGLISFQNAQLLHERERVTTELEVLKQDTDRTAFQNELVGKSPAMRTVLSSVSKVAPTDTTVLITGETGTGKELVARAIHGRSRRARRSFVSVNCAALPASLIATELFGHEKGAFTGAQQRRLGRFELANEGTLFLDEVGELSMETQVALLRVLQERVFERVGGSEPVHVDVRLLAATNRNLQEAVAAGTFRSDLYYRLNVFPIEMPPLRDRKEDIPLLTRHFIDHYSVALGRKIRNVDPATIELFQAYYWPGNIRELQNVVERSLILCNGDTFSVDVKWLSIERPGRPQGSLLKKIIDYERELIENALSESKGKVAGPAGAAHRLGIPSTTLESRIKALDINKNRFRS